MKVTGIVLTILGIAGISYSIYTIIDDTSGFVGYNYSPPDTTHEIVVLSVAFVAFIFTIIGIKKWNKSNILDKETSTTSKSVYTPTPYIAQPTPGTENREKAISPKKNITENIKMTRDDIISKLKELNELKDKGVISEEEFNNLKKKYISKFN